MGNDPLVGQGLLHSVEEQTLRVPLLVSWSAEDDAQACQRRRKDTSAREAERYGVWERAQAVIEEFQDRLAGKVRSRRLATNLNQRDVGATASALSVSYIHN